jgi:hypothetical protein
MKRSFIRYGVFAIIPILVLFIPEISVSDGGPQISSQTDIICSGRLTANQAYNSPGSSNDAHYSDSITSPGDATTVVIKNFSANTESGNALESERFLLSIYDPSVLVRSLYSEENVGLSVTSGANVTATAGSGAAAKDVFTHSETNINSERNILFYYGNLSEGEGGANYSATAHSSDNNSLPNSETAYGLLSTMGGMDFSQNVRVGSATMYEKSYFVLGQEFIIGESISSK